MRSLLMVCAVVCLSLVAGVASASSPGQVPDATLAAFGLNGMQQMTDVQGTNVRGMGFAAVGGITVAKAPGGQLSANGYVAVSDPHHGSALAAGAAGSVAASGVGVFTPGGNFGVVVGGVAIGGAVAYAK
jgi:hypothetical protein